VDEQSVVGQMEKVIEQKPTVGIIGGKGQLGEWCGDLFRAKGYQVLVADQATELTNLELVAQASIVVVTVPIGVTGAVLREISGALRAEQLVVDLTSVKTPFVSLMEESEAEVLSLHPMFAPSLSSQGGQSCIVCEVRPRELTSLFLDLLREEGIRLVSMTPEAHDRMMAVVQGLTHFQAIAAAHCMSELNFDTGVSLESSSPVYRLRLAMIGRILAQNPRLYAEIQIFNPFVRKVLEQLQRSHERLMAFIIAQDVEGFTAEFSRVRDTLGSFSTESLQELSRVV
jgi:prephenate dehydrogenase